MPATLEPNATAPETTQDEGSLNAANTPQVLNPFLFNKPLRTAELFSHAQLMDDSMLTQAGRLKRIIRAITRDYKNDRFDDDTGKRIQMWQDDYAAKAKSMSFEHLVEQGHVNKLIEAYLEALADYHQGKVTKLDRMPVTDPETKDPSAFNRLHDREKAQAEKYRLELQYARKYADAIKDTAKKFPQIIMNAQDLPFGELAVEAGLIKEKDKAKAADMVDDVLATGVAHSIKLIAAPLDEITSADWENYKASPDAYATQIRAMAEKLRNNSKALAYTQVNEDTTPELGQVQSLRNLVSAEIHAALDPNQSPAELMQALSKIEPTVKEYKTVTMSLAHRFLGKGPSAGDARMQALRSQIAEAMGGEDKVLPFETAEAKAMTLARQSAQDLMQVAADKPELKAKLKVMLGQVNPELAAEKLEAKPGMIGGAGSIQSMLGAVQKLGEQLKHMLGMSKSEGTSRAA